MREKFHSLGDLMGYYQWLKFNVDGCTTILPKQNSNFKDKHSALVSQSTKEDKLCFIGDVELFIHAYNVQQRGYFPIPLDCLKDIFLFTFANDIWLATAFPNKVKERIEWTEFRNKFCTLGQLAKRFKTRIANKEKIPRRLAYREYLCDVCSDMRKKAEIYFVALGLIEKTHNKI